MLSKERQHSGTGACSVPKRSLLCLIQFSRQPVAEATLNAAGSAIDDPQPLDPLEMSPVPRGQQRPMLQRPGGDPEIGFGSPRQ